MLKNRSVAVTGATGFVGNVLTERLRRENAVRALVRPNDNRTIHWATRGVEIVQGSLEDDWALISLVRGVDTVFHCAATMGRSDASLSQRVNVKGTERLARAAIDAGVRRFIYVSSISVFAATRRPDGIITESVVPDRVERLNHYGRTKYEGEMCVRALAAAFGLEYTILRPTNIYGPGSGPWFFQFERMLRRVPVAIGDIPIDVVYVDDVVDAMVRAAESEGAARETFHIGHEKIRMNEFICRVGQITGRRARTLPAVGDRLLRKTIDGLYRTITRRHMSMSLVRPVRYPHDKARAKIGYDPEIGIDEGFRRVALWYGGRENRQQQLTSKGITVSS